ncbi:MAG: hypothetical protein AABZ55_15865 [Bdellovibrionota bacterium]
MSRKSRRLKEIISVVLLFSVFGAWSSRADDVDLSADSIEARAVRHSASGNTLLFQSLSSAAALRSEQVIYIRKGSKKIMAVQLLKKQGNSLYLKKIQESAIESAIVDGELYTLVFAVRRPEAVPGSSSGRDSYSVNEEIEGFKIFLEPFLGYSIGKMDLGTLDLGSFGSPEILISTKSIGGGLRLGFGKKRYFGALSFNYGSTKVTESTTGQSLSSILFGIDLGGLVFSRIRLSLGIDFINRLTAADGGYSGSGARLAAGYLISDSLVLSLQINFRSYTTIIIGGSAASLKSLADLGYPVPERISHNEYMLGLNFPFML